jgi:hypothetical protein
VIRPEHVFYPKFCNRRRRVAYPDFFWEAALVGFVRLVISENKFSMNCIKKSQCALTPSEKKLINIITNDYLLITNFLVNTLLRAFTFKKYTPSETSCN